MGRASNLRYRAFISYSHVDARWARWLQSRLENFKIDKDLVGRDTAIGPVPLTLRPIFRDHYEFAPGYSLSQQTLAALEESGSLVVICSVDAARSKYVNEEVRIFVSKYPDRPLIPMIIPGHPGAPIQECFPGALKFAHSDEGASSGSEILAADVRSHADGRDLAVAKVVARLLGLRTDEVYRRFERKKRRETRIRGALALVAALFMTFASIFVWQDYEKRQTLNEVRSLVERLSPVGEVRSAEADRNLTEALSAIVLGASRDPRYQEALRLLRTGRSNEAVPLLTKVAQGKVDRIASDTKEAAAAFRHLGAIAGLGDQRQARSAYAEALKLVPEDIDAVYWFGYLSYLVGDSKSADQSFKKLIEVAAREHSDAGEYLAYLRLGEIELAKGNRSAAWKYQKNALAIAQILSVKNASDLQWARNLAASYDKIGDLLRTEGKLPAATEHYQAFLSIAERLAKVDQANPSRLRDLSIAHIKVGDTQLDAGNYDSAFDSYKFALNVSTELANLRPDAPGWKRDLTVSYERMGDALLARGKLSEALRSYETCLSIRETILFSDPGNAGWMHDLSVAYERIGDLLYGGAKFPDALVRFRAALDIRTKLAIINPDNLRWKRDISISYNKIGGTFLALKSDSDAFVSFETAFEIRRDLVLRDPENSEWQANLAASHGRLAEVQVALGDTKKAVSHFRAARSIILPLVQQSANRAWTDYLATFEEGIRALEE